MAKFRRTAINPEVEQTFENFERLMGGVDAAVARGENFGNAYEQRDIPYQMMGITNNRQNLIESFVEDFPQHTTLLRYTPFFERMINTGTRRIWMCYQAAKAYSDPNLAFVERIQEILTS
jgi:hypothetical protein